MIDYRNDIEKYIKGELTPAERNALERKALHDPFLADALAGAEQINASDFSKDVDSLHSQIAAKKSISTWMWTARIAAGLAIIAVSSFIVWTVMKPEPAQDLAFEKSEPVVTPSAPTDSITPATEALSSPTDEQPARGPGIRDKDVATRSSRPFKTEAKPALEAKDEPVLKNEPAAGTGAIAAEEKADVAKAEDITVTESLAQAKEAEVSRAKEADDLHKTTSKKKAALADQREAAPSAVYKSEGYSSVSNVIRGQVTSAEDGSALPGVNIIIKGSTIGTVTDGQGNYAVTVPDTNPTLVYSFIGLQSTEVKPENRAEVNVKMTTDVTQLSEVITVGSGLSSVGKTITPTIDLAHPEIGSRAFKQYLEKNLRYPDLAKRNKVEGRVTVEFTVETDGSLTNFIILRGIGSGCDEELIRLINEGPNWIPTKMDNNPIQDKAKVRLRFQL